MSREETDTQEKRQVMTEAETGVIWPTNIKIDSHL